MYERGSRFRDVKQGWEARRTDKVAAVLGDIAGALGTDDTLDMESRCILMGAVGALEGRREGMGQPIVTYRL